MPVSPAFIIRLTLAASGLALLLPSIAAAAADSAEPAAGRAEPAAGRPDQASGRASRATGNLRPADKVAGVIPDGQASPLAGPAVTPPSAPSPLFTIKAPDLKELSGLAESDAGDAFYGIQDAGNAAEVFVLDRSGDALGTIPVPFANVDWEDITLVRQPGRTGILYIADTGDASLARKKDNLPPRDEFAIIRIDEPDISRPQTLRSADDAIRYPVTFSGDESHNVETILIEPATGRVYLVDKVTEGGKPAGVWEGPPVLSPDGNLFQKVASLPITGVSSGSFSPGGRFLALRDADRAYIWAVGTGGTAGALASAPSILTLPEEPQGEALTFVPDGSALLVGSEGEKNPVISVPLPASLHDPVYPFTADPVPNRAPLYLLVFGGGAAIIIVLVILVRRRRIGSDF